MYKVEKKYFEMPVYYVTSIEDRIEQYITEQFLSGYKLISFSKIVSHDEFNTLGFIFIFETTNG